MVKRPSKLSAVSKNDDVRIERLISKISHHIVNARQTVQRTVDIEMINAYWLIGRDIVKEEQQGKKRADYGSYVLKELSKRLTRQHGKGFGLSTLKDMRQFYIAYSKGPIGHAVRGQSKGSQINSNLGWIHYRALMRISSIGARRFYEIEAIKNHWSGRELERQIDSLLYDRLAKSKNKKGIMNLTYKGQEVIQPEDAIKEPLVLEFLNLPESHKIVESKLEESLIANLQQFLLELGTGFAFVARQKRLTLDGEYFYADLVFYHIVLKCYVVIDLKTKKLSHADLGQMLLYVNFFDHEIKSDDDNPTIGLVLCTKKSEAMVKYMLGEKAKQIFAKRYQFHLPTEEELEAELIREIKRLPQKSVTLNA